MAFRPGQKVYAAHPDEIEELTVVERGSGDFNLKRRVRDPYVVRGRDGSEWVYPGDILHADRLAAAAHSAQMMAELDETSPRGNPTPRFPPYSRQLKVGDRVQFSYEPGTGGVIQSFEGGTALVSTSRGVRKVPTNAIKLSRSELMKDPDYLPAWAKVFG